MPRDEEVEVLATPEESKAVANNIFDLEDSDDTKDKPGTDSRTSTKTEGSNDGHSEDFLKTEGSEESEDSEEGHPSKTKAEGHPQPTEPLLAGRYRTVQDLVKGCNELAKQLGIKIDWDQYMEKTVEDVVSLYKRLSADYTKMRTSRSEPDTSYTQLGEQQQTTGYPALQQILQQAPAFGQQAPYQQYPFQATQQDPRDAEIAQLRNQLVDLATYIVKMQQQGQQGQQGQQIQPQQQLTPEEFYEKLVQEGPKVINELLDQRLQQYLAPYIQQFTQLQQYVANLERQRIAERNINQYIQMKNREWEKFEKDYGSKITPEIGAEMKKILQTNPTLVLQPGGYEMLYRLARGIVADASTTENSMLKKKMAAFIGSRTDAPKQTLPTEEDYLNKMFDL